MTRFLRGAWSRRGALATLVAMTTVVVGGAVGVLGFAAAAGTSRLLAAPLLLLGAVAVPSIGAELATARREEIGLARLRGIHGPRLWRFLLLEPLGAVAVGTVLGLALGAGVTVASTSLWLDDAADPLDRAAVLTAVATAVAGLVIVVVSSAAALREPLAVQVATRQRPRRATTTVVFLSVLVIVGAAVAAYRSRTVATADPDALVLLGPALVGLAFGQVAIWVLRLGARVSTVSTGGRGIAPFLATRRLARADDLVTPLRLVVAAAVVAILATTGALAVDDWTDTESRVAAAGPTSVDVSGGALGALALTHELDPEGEHLMATAVVPNLDRLAERRAYVDATRFAAVVGDFYDGTPVEDAARAVPELASDLPDLTLRGDRLTVSARALAKGSGDSRGVTLEVVYVGNDDARGSALVDLPLERTGARVTRSVRLRGCADGCQLTGMAVTRLFGERTGVFTFDTTPMTVLLESVEVGDLDLARLAWQPDVGNIKSNQSNRFRLDAVDPLQRVTANRPDGLEVAALPDGPTGLVLTAAAAPLRVLSAGAGDPAPLDLGSQERPAAVVGEFDTLPLVGGVGVLSDLAAASVASGPTVPSTEVRIVADADTPDAVLAQVAAATGSPAQSLEDLRDGIGTDVGAAQARAYVLTAVACVLVALLALAAGVARHRRSYRHDVAALRVMGIGVGTARRAGRAELAALALLVVVAVTVGGWAAVQLLLGGLPLITPSAAAQPLDTGARVPALVLPALLAAAAVLVVGGRARAVRDATTRPSLLRDEERR
ncbi:hypothetical protein [Nocardioides sp. Soil805]|uniref:hypothetical protein n=1 Tax=Nocardioides sp. Soil805 TaxID=1736416 RepID=UPI000703B2D7|nr:hypothetical protein [Nocardioides sp. Soil805]KRF34622.1 hypothetical protein ASG94_10585 [Nocardioides sp. Soil805]